MIIDFTTGEAATALSKACAARGGPALVMGATGFTSEELGRLRNAALDRSMFAHGALAAARRLIGRAPGEYDMQDVPGLRFDRG